MAQLTAKALQALLAHSISDDSVLARAEEIQVGLPAVTVDVDGYRPHKLTELALTRITYTDGSTPDYRARGFGYPIRLADGQRLGGDRWIDLEPELASNYFARKG